VLATMAITTKENLHPGALPATTLAKIVQDLGLLTVKVVKRLLIEFLQLTVAARMVMLKVDQTVNHVVHYVNLAMEVLQIVRVVLIL
jgi:hypothetical protein